MFDSDAHLKALFAAAPKQFEFRASSADEWLLWQQAFRPRLRTALGLDNMESDLRDHHPEAELAESEDVGTYTREHWRLWVEPTVPLPFHLLRPKRHATPIPLVLTPHGHNHPRLYVGIAADDDERAHMAEGERDIACQAAEQGYLAIAPTTRAFGETRTRADLADDKMHSCRTQLMHDLLVGRTPIGERVWDTSRLIDWALANEQVDPRRIAITGNSGGGTVSLFAAACDTRITVAVPSCYFCTFQGSIGAMTHCDCNYVPGLLRLGEMDDVAGLIAPRPFCAIAGREDPIFPIDHARSAFGRLRRTYEVAGVPERCSLYEGDGGHRYYKGGAWPFIRRHFDTAAV